MALSFKNLVSSVLGSGTAKDDKPPSASELFVKTDPKVDGEECLHDCDNCSARYPRGFKIEEEDVLYGHVAAWSTHVLVGTGKTDWVRDVEEEEGSVMQAFSKAVEPSNGVSLTPTLNESMSRVRVYLIHLNSFMSCYVG
jgi:glycerol-3-phosphate O-acyltransferase/dihydroxyacetone phosphate acyltransferase